ncbi:MAG: AzlC family ABC transporter permease [Ruminococcaceae bacterium]|nr:AzlC family ABC transporter permease [Oscillospiraceae bacterium]
MKKNDFKKGLIHGIPICLGYLAVSFSFGIFAVGQGLSIAEVVLISMTNVTSAGQLAGVPIIAGAGSLIELASTQFIINLRYALMSVSLSQKMDKSVRLPDRFLIAFVNTDEVFAVSAVQPEGVSRSYMYGLITTPYLGWAFGTALGAIAGDILPAIVSTALGVAIYGMFIAIVVPDAKKHKPTALCVLTAIALSLLFYYVPVLSHVPSGFVIIICAVIASALFAFLAPIDTGKKGGEDA